MWGIKLIKDGKVISSGSVAESNRDRIINAVNFALNSNKSYEAVYQNKVDIIPHYILKQCKVEISKVT